MLSQGWIGATPLNTWGAPARTITFAAVAQAAASAVAGTIVRQRAFAAQALAEAAGAALTLQGIVPLASAFTLAQVTSRVDHAPIRNFTGSGPVFVTGTFSFGSERTFAASVTATATGFALLGGVLFAASNTVTATVAPVVMRRGRLYAGSAQAVATATSGRPFVRHQFRQSVEATAVATPADMDIRRGGIRRAHFSARVSATAAATADSAAFRKVFGASVTAGADAQLDMVRKQRRFQPETTLVQALALAEGVRRVAALSGTGDAIVVTATGAMTAERAMAAAGQALSQAGATRLRLDPAALSGSASVVASGTSAPPFVRAGLSGFADVFVGAEASEIRLATRFAGEASVSVTGLADADMIELFTQYLFAGSASVIATAEATELRNLLQRLSGTAVTGASASLDASQIIVYRLIDMRATGDAVVTSEAQVAYIAALRAEANTSVDTSAQIVAIVDMVPAPAEAVVTVSGSVITNAFDDEPDYRTVTVPRQSFVASVNAQPFVVNVTRDTTSMQTFSKQPGDVLPYDINMADWFVELEGDEIQQATCVVTDASDGNLAGLQIQSVLKIGDPCLRIKIWTAGGIDGVTYKLTATIDTEGGRRKQVDFRLRIKDV